MILKPAPGQATIRSRIVSILRQADSPLSVPRIREAYVTEHGDAPELYVLAAQLFKLRNSVMQTIGSKGTNLYAYVDNAN